MKSVKVPHDATHLPALADRVITSGTSGTSGTPGTRAPLRSSEKATAPPLDFTSVYEGHFHEAERWFRALGAPPSEIPDLAQEVFLVVRRKLEAFDGGNLVGWLYTITERTWRDHRRRAWFRNFFTHRTPLVSDGLESPGMSPEKAYEVSESWALARQVLAKMDERRRVPFVLFEIEGYSGEEIADVLGVPVATIWTRLHKGRREFVEGLARLMEE